MSASIAALVDKATSDLLIGPDWGKNIELCDAVNSDPGHAKEAIKAVKKRLANKSSTVQLLALTLLETLVKNCGDVVHQQVAERDVLHEMVKIVKKKTQSDLSVRDKILVLLDTWQEAFGGARGRLPQYYAAYNELKQMGVEFPQRTPEESVPIFTPPQTHPISAPPPHFPDAAFADPHAFGSNAAGMSMSDLENARGGLEVLTDMLNAINPGDKAALKEDLIVELVEQCRTTQKQVMNLASTTSDETLLFQALALNDDLQKALAKHDAIASGTPLPSEQSTRTPVPNFLHEDEESEDEYTELARRTSRSQPQPAAAQKPAVVPILPPPRPPARLSTPGGTGVSSPSVDLLSGETYAAQQPQIPKAQAPAAPAAMAAPVTAPLRSSSSNLASAASTPFAEEDEDPENVNPFSIQHRQSPASQESGLDYKPQNSSLSPQQQALLYGSEAPAQNLLPTSTSKLSSQGGFLPPPPSKHSQRQQFFQKHQHSSGDEQLASRAQQALSLDSTEEDEQMQNPYASVYAQRQSQQQQQDHHQQFHRPGSDSPSDNLFGDLVDLQSARIKSTTRSNR